MEAATYVAICTVSCFLPSSVLVHATRFGPVQSGCFKQVAAYKVQSTVFMLFGSEEAGMYVGGNFILRLQWACPPLHWKGS